MPTAEMRRPLSEKMCPARDVLPLSPNSTIEKRTAALEPAKQPLAPGMHRKKRNPVRTAHSAQVLLSFGFDLWENIEAHLSPLECGAFAATCREAWSRPLTKAVIAAPPWHEGAVSELTRATSVQRTRHVLKHCSTLKTLSLELWGISDNVRELALATHNHYMPQLQQLSIKMSPRWAASLSKPQPMRHGDCMVLRLLQDQLSATKACLQSLSRRAPNLRVLSVIDDGTLRTLPSSFSMLNHVILDCWWSLDLRAMTRLEYFSVMRHMPDTLQLPRPCQMHVGDIESGQLGFLYSWLPRLTRMEVAVSDFCHKSRSHYHRRLLNLDLHLDDLTLRFHDIGPDKEPITISVNSWPILRQAKHVSLFARDISIKIASHATLAWRKVLMIADRQLTLKCRKPEVLLEGRSAIVLQYSRTNIPNASVVWRPIAQKLGLSITTSNSESKGEAVHTLCLSIGSAENQKFLQAPCGCHACINCLDYYDMLK